jgi:hypothetical protein
MKIARRGFGVLILLYLRRDFVQNTLIQVGLANSLGKWAFI